MGSSFHCFLGWACLIMSPIWYFLSVWDFNQRYYGAIFLFIIGVTSLKIYEDEKKC